MKCKNCSYINSDDAVVCDKCGSQLLNLCPNCGTANLLDAKYCKECGKRLIAGHSLDQNNAIPALRKTTRQKSHETTQEHSPSVFGERKSITILFTDIVGSTTLAEGLDPEDWKDIVAGAHRLIESNVQRYGGYIAQFLGDGVLAFFGAPTTHEDDPVRAVQAALDIQNAVQQYSYSLRQLGRVPAFQMRVGINTGPVVVDLVGSQTHREYSAFGDAVNLAARMQSAANPGKVLISEDTYKNVSHAFHCSDLGLIQVKGKSAPVRVFEVRDRGLHAIRKHPQSGLKSSMVGRTSELNSLIEVSNQVLMNKKALVISLIAEPGLGKSRLIAEWRKSIESEVDGGGNWLCKEGQCLSYSQTMPYWLIRSLLRSILNLNAKSSEVDARNAISALVMDSRFVLPEEQTRYLLWLLEYGKNDPALMPDPQSLQSQTFSALRGLLLEMSSRQPVCLILEDIHWADRTSVDVLLKLIPALLNSPIIVCLVTRPEPDSSGWNLIEDARNQPAEQKLELTLTHLPSSDIQLLIKNLLQIDSISPDIQKLIETKSDGNPFFIEEVLRLLMDQAVLVRRNDRWVLSNSEENVDVPESLQQLLLARIDHLVEKLKQTLRVASVIGRSFLFEILHVVLEDLYDQFDRDQLKNQLIDLENTGLVLENDNAWHLEYLFRHALVQEAAYSALLKNDRRSLHRAVGIAIQQLFPDRLDELASTIAYHYEHGEDWVQAVWWLKHAADLAFDGWALPEAIDLGQRAVKALSHLENQQDLQGRLHQQLAVCMMRAGIPREKTLEEFRLSLKFTKDKRDKAEIHFFTGQLFHIYTSSDLAASEKEYNLALDLLNHDESDPLFCSVLAFLGYLYRYQSRIPLSIETLRHALNLANSLDSVERQADINIFLSGAYLDAGREDEALSACLEGLNLAKKLGNLELIGRAHSFCRDVYLTRAISGQGSVEEALPHIKEMLRFGQEYNTAVLAGLGEQGMGIYLSIKGDLVNSLAHWSESARIWLQVHAPSRAGYSHSRCGEIQLRLGERNAALDSFRLVKLDLGAENANRADFFIGLAYAGAGLGKPATRHLKTAFDMADSPEQLSNWIQMIRTDPEFTQHRGLPEIAKLLNSYQPVKNTLDVVS
jgi:class 3 adenylate cyclase/predicted ATPase